MVLDTCGTFSLPARLAPAGDSDGSDLLLSEHVSSAGGMHRLCWCGMPPCEKATHFNVDAGHLLLLGPSPLQQQMTCVSGQSCIVQLSSSTMTAMETSMHTSVYLYDACPATTLVNAAAAIAGPLQQSAPVLLTAAGGVYRMCWCSALHGNVCAPSDYIVDAGQLLLIGPSPHSQTRTCIGGLACRFHDFDGLYLQPEDRLLLLDTCGQSSYIGAAAFLHPPGSQSTHVDWQVRLRALETQFGAVQTRTCSFPRLGAFIEYVGALVEAWHQMLSPLLGHFPALGDYVDSIAILETCAVAMSPGLRALSPGGVNASQSPLSGKSSLVAWDLVENASEVPRLQEGALYRLCWCLDAQGCSRVEDYRADVGGLLVVGPSPLLQLRTCISGHSCAFEGVTGLGLSYSYYISRIRLYQDGATSHDIRVWELYHSESPNGPWIKAFNGAAAPGVGEQEFEGDQPLLALGRAADLLGSSQLRDLSSYPVSKLVDGKLEDDSRALRAARATAWDQVEPWRAGLACSLPGLAKEVEKAWKQAVAWRKQQEKERQRAEQPRKR
ncbi:agaA33 [Symbiodinium sp. CCMP2592]|nr:agaA33 [Symbiodinium sp. CCMP2592]